MNKRTVLAISLGLWAGGMTLLVLKQQKDIYFLADSLERLLNHLEQRRYDEKFVHIINNIDGDEEGNDEYGLE